jgi:hypothetical protein
MAKKAPNEELEDDEVILTDEEAEKIGYKKPAMTQKPKEEELEESEDDKDEQVETEAEKKKKEKAAKKAADPRPRIPVVYQGQELRRKRAVDIGLSEKILPPLTKGVMAVYRLIASTRIDPATKELAGDKDISLPGHYMLYDTFEPDPLKKRKPMYNYGNPKVEFDKDGNRKVVDTIKSIEFVTSTFRVDPERDYRLYTFMELHPLNGSNRHRENTGTPAMFERVDIKNFKSPGEIAAEMDLAHEAEYEIMKIVSKDKILGLAVSANVYQQGMGPGEAKNELRAWARKDPRKYFRLLGDIKPAIKLNLLTGMTFGIVEYRQDIKSFRFSESGDVFFTHVVGEEAVDACTDFLAKPENAALLTALTGLVDYWE